MIKIKSSCLVFLLVSITTFPQNLPDSILREIKNGAYSKAEKNIEQLAATGNLDATEKMKLLFEGDRLKRIQKDFSKTENQIRKELQALLVGYDFSNLEQYEKNNSLEMMVIDGEKKYFKNAAPNLFRLDKNLKQLREEQVGLKADNLQLFKEKIVPVIIQESEQKKTPLVSSTSFHIIYTLTVKPNIVPEGELIRCWLPYPKEHHARQGEIKLIALSEEKYIVAPDATPQRTVYMEKPAVKDAATIFSIEYEYSASAERNNIFRNGVVSMNDSSLHEFVGERPPHIVFTEEIKKLSQKIVGGESNKLETAKKIFTWLNDNIPWASALEYSTIPNISMYCLNNLHGDCGIKTLLFMTLCRYNGIPAQWQSGWMLHPVEVNLHDWCEIYVEPFGWVPVDQSFGVIRGKNDEERYFYLGSTDQYHLIINDDYSQPLVPAKIFPRSETVDFQRGEVEWRGGNIYFDGWNYNIQVKYNKGTNDEKN